MSSLIYQLAVEATARRPHAAARRPHAATLRPEPEGRPSQGGKGLAASSHRTTLIGPATVLAKGEGRSAASRGATPLLPLLSHRPLHFWELQIVRRRGGRRWSGEWKLESRREAVHRKKFQAMAYSAAMKVPVATIELYLDVRSQIEDQIQGFSEPVSDKLLPDLAPQDQHVLTLILDLNETLVYSDWKRERGWRTFKRPGVDAFLEHLGKFYEIVVFSYQLSMYVDPVVDRLDPKSNVRHRLSRIATKYENGKHYRDLSKLNRNPAKVLYISGHALESSLQAENCVPIKPWKLENDDTQLLDLIPFLEYVAMARPSDVRTVLASYQGHDIATEFIERSKEHQRRMLEQKQPRRLWQR